MNWDPPSGLTADQDRALRLILAGRMTQAFRAADVVAVAALAQRGWLATTKVPGGFVDVRAVPHLMPAALRAAYTHLRTQQELVRQYHEREP